MKRNHTHSLSALVGLSAFASLASFMSLGSAFAAGRERVSLDSDWRFHLGDAPGAEQPAFAEEHWRVLDVPHDWSIEGEFAETNRTGGAGGFLPAGVGWYRKHFTIPAGPAGRRVFVRFDGVMANSDVWVNGFLLGHRPYGYVSLEYELTGHLNREGENVLAVRADNSPQPASRWYAGAGIYRHAWLTLTDPLHLLNDGLFVSTPKAAADQAAVRVQASVTNQADVRLRASVQVTLLGPDGQTAVKAECPARDIGPGQSTEFQQELSLAKPVLWDIEHPALYRAVVDVLVDGATRDQQAVLFGIRDARFEAGTGFWLNCKTLKLKGVCLHHDGGAFGAAVPLGVWERRLEQLRQAGCNAIRTAHNPPAPEFLDLCDRNRAWASCGGKVSSTHASFWPSDGFGPSKKLLISHNRDTERLTQRTPNMVHLKTFAATALPFFALCSYAAPVETTRQFEFGSSQDLPGHLRIQPSALYSPERGYGFEPGANIRGLSQGGHCCTSEQPFLFSVRLPEGNYDVGVTLGNPAAGSTNTVKAECRRLMLERVATAPGQFTTRSFTVNIRTPKISENRAVRLKPREQGIFDWDDKLTLEFNGTAPAVSSIQISPASNAVTVFLLGDSTVTDQPKEPWNSWGQMLTRFFTPVVAVANHAESGESLKSSLNAHRVDKVLTSLKTGDYVFVQFGHNDQKDRATNALATFTANLKQLVDDVRAHKATPVLVTSMERMAGVEKDTLGEYPATVSGVAREEGVALIDLHAMSRTLYRALGPELKQAFQDGTHHNAYGSYELARCVVDGIKQNKLPLAGFLAPDVPAFDPGRPDPVENFQITPSPQRDLARPEGN